MATTTSPPDPVVRGTFLLFSSWARVLVDTGASHSFIASSFGAALGLETSPLDPPLYVDTPIGGRVMLDRVCRECDLTIEERTFVFDFIVLDMSAFDVILGMDWLSSVRAVIDCYRRRVTICTAEGDVQISGRQIRCDRSGYQSSTGQRFDCLLACRVIVI